MFNKDNSVKVNELSKEISDMKDAIHQLKLAVAQNLQEHANIVKEKNDLRECYRTAVEEAEKKLLVLRKEYEPELSRTLEAKLMETISEIEILREEMKKAHETDMNTIKIITSELNDATMKLHEAAHDESSPKLGEFSQDGARRFEKRTRRTAVERSREVSY